MPGGIVPRQLIAPHVARDSASRTSDSYDPVVDGSADRRKTLAGLAVASSRPRAPSAMIVGDLLRRGARQQRGLGGLAGDAIDLALAARRHQQPALAVERDVVGRVFGRRPHLIPGAVRLNAIDRALAAGAARLARRAADPDEPDRRRPATDVISVDTDGTGVGRDGSGMIGGLLGRSSPPCRSAPRRRRRRRGRRAAR